MTRVEGLILHPFLKGELLAEFKKKLGCGGCLREGALEFQGDKRDILQAELLRRGYKIKRIGG